MEEQLVRWGSARHDARPADAGERQGRGGRASADRSAFAYSRRAGWARGCGLCTDRQRHSLDEPEHTADQQAVEADAALKFFALRLDEPSRQVIDHLRVA